MHKITNNAKILRYIEGLQEGFPIESAGMHKSDGAGSLSICQRLHPLAIVVIIYGGDQCIVGVGQNWLMLASNVQINCFVDQFFLVWDSCAVLVTVVGLLYRYGPGFYFI